MNWKINIHDLTSSLNRANVISAKLRHFVNSEILRSTYFTIFHFSFELFVYSLRTYKIFSTKSLYSPIKKNEEVWILLLLMLTLHICSKVVIFWSLPILFVESCVFINNCFNKDSFSIFNGSLKFVSTSHSYNTRSASNGLLCVPSYNSVRFGRKSIINSTTLTWNCL